MSRNLKPDLSSGHNNQNRKQAQPSSKVRLFARENALVMKGKHDEAVWQQTRTLEDLRLKAVEMARAFDNGLQDDTKKALRDLSGWLLDRSARFQALSKSKTKVSITRLRLLTLQLEKLLEQISRGASLTRPESFLCEKLYELLESQQRRDLYDDMISCLRELSTLSVERGLGRQAVLYNDMAQRLELRLESGHIELDNEEQRAKDEALYAEFQQKLESMRL
jgi:hypothetical protein